MSDSIILIGAGGHSKVVIDCIQASGAKVIGILDDGVAPGTFVLGIPVLGRIEDFKKYLCHQFLIAIGNNNVRRRISQELPVKWHTAVHPSSVISPYATIGSGTVIMPGAIVNAGAAIGMHCIINTGAIVEHDNRIGDYVHLSPGVSLGGTVSVGAGTHIGIGSSVRNNISICENCVVGAGAVVVKDIAEQGIYIGVPARRME